MSGLFLPKQKAVPVKARETTLGSPDFASVSGEILRACQALQDAEGAGKLLLVVDQLDLLLAAGGDQIGAVNVSEMLMGFREVSHILS